MPTPRDFKITFSIMGLMIFAACVAIWEFIKFVYTHISIDWL